MAVNEGVIIPPSSPSKEWLEAQVENPQLAAGTIQQPFLQSVQEDELLQPGTAQIPITPKAEREPIALAVAQDATVQPDAAVQAATQQPTAEAATVKSAPVTPVPPNTRAA